MSRVLKTGNNQITQHYGHNGHTGVDLVKYSGQTDTIIAHSSGKVIFCQTGMTHNNEVGNNASYGNCIKIKHDNGMYTLYAHLANIYVGLGQYVKQGQDIGYMGNTGNSSAAHLHFEVFNANNQRINPEPYLDSDLPGGSSNPGYTGTITYQAYTNKWLPEVNKCDNTPEGYAGLGDEFITGFRCKPQYGEIIYEAHLLNGNWLGEVNSRDYKTNDTQDGNSYSGIYGQPIDAIKIRSTQGFVKYRVKTKNRGWLPYVIQNEDYAGNFGEAIIGLQME